MPDRPEALVTAHLPAAMLLAATGGLLDAVVYLDHGHVFANAMTGNLIFLGIAVTGADWAQVLRHAVPLAAFLAGVLAARFLAETPGRRGSLIPLTLEIAALAVLGALPLRFPQLAFTGIVSFVSAFQLTAFRRVGRFTYNSTFVTGNLREVADGLYDRLRSPDPGKRALGGRKSIKLASICLGFLAGALAGAWLAERFPAHALWAAEPMLLIVLLLVLLRPNHFKP